MIKNLIKNYLLVLSFKKKLKQFLKILNLFTDIF